MGAPPLLLDRPPAAQIILAVGLPLIFGIVCGILADVSNTAYLVVSILAILGGLAAGYEHPTADEGSVRGFCGGLVFGTAIITTVAIITDHPKAHLPHPHIGVVIVTTVAGMILGAIGGLLRRRHDSREAASDRLAARRAA